MKITDCNTNLSFNAQIGDNLLKSINDEFCNNTTKIAKFKNLFDTTYRNVVDESTVIDINSERRYLLSHEFFPDISLILRQHVLKERPLAEAIIVECPKTFGWGENLLFKKIIREKLKQFDFQELESIAEVAIKNDKNRKYFLEIIECARRIISENPSSELSDSEFEIMENKILQEKFETPGTEEYEMVNSWLQNVVRKVGESQN